MSVTTANVGSALDRCRILILIFAEALGLYGLIVGLVGEAWERRIDELYGRPKLDIESGKTYENFIYIYCLFTIYIYIYVIFTHCILYSFNEYRFLPADCQ